MDYTWRVSLTIAVGIIIAIFYSRRTGWSVGGLVTPGLLAVQAASPMNFTGALLLALVFAAILRPLAKIFGLFGRERVGAALLIAILFRLIFHGRLGTDIFWLGWVAPGLIAADIERQGVPMTFASVISASVATALLASLLFPVLERLA